MSQPTAQVSKGKGRDSLPLLVPLADFYMFYIYRVWHSVAGSRNCQWLFVSERGRVRPIQALVLQYFASLCQAV